jgi:hypothetical protein
MILGNTPDTLCVLDVGSNEPIRLRRVNRTKEEITDNPTAGSRGRTPDEAFGDELGRNSRQTTERVVTTSVRSVMRPPNVTVNQLFDRHNYHRNCR